MTSPSFKERQMTFTRIREAYAEKKKSVDKTLGNYHISADSLRIYLRVFKTEKKIELWAKNCNNKVFTFIKEFPICEMSGELGPKRRSRDLQVPEGFYHISNLNPYSKYYLSMQINYPNASDSIRGVHGHLGNLIFIHGDCVSSGCMAITDQGIKELFVYCVEAYNSGQKQIDVTIFPAQLTDSVYSKLTAKYSKYKDELSLWADLKMSYDLFYLTKIPSVIKFLPDGNHMVDGSSTANNLQLAGTLIDRYEGAQHLDGLLQQLHGKSSLVLQSKGTDMDNSFKLAGVNVD